MTDLEAFGQEQQTRLEAKRSEIDVLRNRVTDGQLTLAKDQLAKMQAELDTKTGEFKRLSEDAQRAFNQRQGQLLQDIEKQIMPIINQVGAEGGYTAIFRKFDSGLVYADKAIDITRQVIARLDAGPTGK